MFMLTGRRIPILRARSSRKRLQRDHYEVFERAVKTSLRPVLVQLGRPPFRDFAADDLFGGDLKKRVNGEWVSAFQGTLGQMADACIYLGMAPDVETRIAAVEKSVSMPPH